MMKIRMYKAKQCNYSPGRHYGNGCRASSWLVTILELVRYNFRAGRIHHTTPLPNEDEKLLSFQRAVSRNLEYELKGSFINWIDLTKFHTSHTFLAPSAPDFLTKGIFTTHCNFY